MDEASQIFGLLSNADFWEDDQNRGWSMQMPGGMSVEIGQNGSNWVWKVTGPDGAERISSKAFPSIREAKNDLRVELKRRRESIIYEGMGPADMS
jgi:hypothetical protein